MKLIIDSKLVNRLESEQLHPNRLFFCEKCNCNYRRNSVKKIQGNYFCVSCGQSVVDISNTEDGQQLISILGM